MDFLLKIFFYEFSSKIKGSQPPKEEVQSTQLVQIPPTINQVLAILPATQFPYSYRTMPLARKSIVSQTTSLVLISSFLWATRLGCRLIILCALSYKISTEFLFGHQYVRYWEPSQQSVGLVIRFLSVGLISQSFMVGAIWQFTHILCPVLNIFFLQNYYLVISIMYHENVSFQEISLLKF